MTNIDRQWTAWSADTALEAPCPPLRERLACAIAQGMASILGGIDKADAARIVETSDAIASALEALSGEEDEA